MSVRYWQTAAIVFAVMYTGVSGWHRLLLGCLSLVCLAMVLDEERKAAKAAEARPRVVFTGEGLSFPDEVKR